MNTICRLAIRPINRKYFMGLNGFTPIRGARVTITKYKPPPPEDDDHDYRNMSRDRPQSPHLTIYAKELQAFMSIMHRLTGIGLAVYSLGASIIALVFVGEVSDLIDKIQALNLSMFIIYPVKAILALPYMYHLANGIRHFIWDTGAMLSIGTVLSSAKVVLVLVAAATTGVVTCL